ncbi:cytochrome P450 [Mycena rosella]|uniref:Cytochrome P450 n=1 Tax=Mycena rosella TaxID=1033263 RepID=A0AAD7D618_MYCRO|nr:cytochrome P450 [Mycena rosella]
MLSVTFICAVLLVLVYGIRTLLRCVSSVLDKIPGPPPKSWLTGHLTQYHDPDGWAFHKDLEEKYGQVVRLHGLFGDRGLYVFEPAALHSILIKDQDIYEEMPRFLSLNKLLFGPGIFSTIGDDHRKYRKIMIPAFSTANLRGIVPLFYDVAERARDGLIAPNISEGPRMLDLNAILCRTSLELIGRTGIGYSFDSMLPGKEQPNRYAEALRALHPTAFKLSVLLPLLPLILKIPFPSFRRFMINLVPSPTLHHLRDLVDITDGIATQLVTERKAAIKSGELDVKEGAKDIMSLMIKNNVSAEGSMRLTDSELVASIAMIIFAATDTTASSMNRMFHILALYPKVQEKLRAEILDTPEHLHHDALVALPYLDGFVRELLRLFPSAAPGMYREHDTILPLRTPIIGVDGTLMNTITVPKGTSIYIAIAAANHSKQIWGDDALEFKPERWTNGKAKSVMTKMCGIYGNTMTFLGGGRSCIGFKFAQLEMKAVASVLLRAFKFSTPDPRVQWRMTGAVPSPNVHGQPGLPILVERLNV